MELECTQVISETFNDGCSVPERGRLKVGLLEVNGTPFDIFTGENVIGRDALSDIVIDKGSISSKHAVLEVDHSDSHLLFDCGSTNKTRIGKTVLKPHVMYSLQGGEEILFADVKSKYTKLEPLREQQPLEDSGSETGSESMLDCGAESFEGDLDKDNPTEKLVSQDNLLKELADKSLNKSNPASEPNESLLLEQTDNVISDKVVDASLDESTDDEEDFFVLPSQTVKEFTSSQRPKNINVIHGDKQFLTQDIFDPIFIAKQITSKKASEIDNSKDIFDAETQEAYYEVKNNLDEQHAFDSESQNIFNAEAINEKLHTEQKEVFDCTLEANTEITNVESESSKQSEQKKDEHLFAAETEMVICENDNEGSQQMLTSRYGKFVMGPVVSHEKNHENDEEKTSNLIKEVVSEVDEKRLFDSETEAISIALHRKKVEENAFEEHYKHGLFTKDDTNHNTDSCKISNTSNLDDEEMSELVLSSTLTEIGCHSQHSESLKNKICDTQTIKIPKIDLVRKLDTQYLLKNNEKLIHSNDGDKGQSPKNIQSIVNSRNVDDNIFDALTQLNTNTCSTNVMKVQNCVNEINDKEKVQSYDNPPINASNIVIDDLSNKLEQNQCIDTNDFDELTQVNQNLKNSNQISEVKEKGSIKEVDSFCEALTQVNHNLNNPNRISILVEESSNEAVNPSNSCCESLTQVNTALNHKEFSEQKINEHVESKNDGKLNLKKSDTEIAYQETKLHSQGNHFQENKHLDASCDFHTFRNTQDVEKFCLEETQVNVNIHGQLTQKNEVKKEQITDPNEALTEPFVEKNQADIVNDEAETELFLKENQANIVNDSDNTDIEDSIKDNGTYDNSIKSHSKTSSNEKQHLVELNEDSTESDSLLASIPLDLEDLGVESPSKQDISHEPKLTLSENNLRNKNESTFKGSVKDSCSTSTITVTDMDVCSTVGGMKNTICENSTTNPLHTVDYQIEPSESEPSLYKSVSETCSKLFEQHKISAQKIPKDSNFGKCLEKCQIKATSIETTVNDSLVLSDPCSSSTPFKTNVDAKNTTDVLPLSLKRTPRLKKMSRKLVESVLTKEADKTVSNSRSLKKSSKELHLNKKNSPELKNNNSTTHVKQIILNENCNPSKVVESFSDLRTEVISPEDKMITSETDLEVFGKEFKSEVDDYSTGTTKSNKSESVEILEDSKKMNSVNRERSKKIQLFETGGETRNSSKKGESSQSLDDNMKQSYKEDYISNERGNFEANKVNDSNKNLDEETIILDTDVLLDTSSNFELQSTKHLNDLYSLKHLEEDFKCRNNGEEPSPSKRSRLSSKNVEEQLNNLKFKSKQGPRRCNRGSSKTESQELRSTELTKSYSFSHCNIKRKTSPKKIGVVSPSSVQRTSFDAVKTLTTMDNSLLHDGENVKDILYEPLKKSRRIIKSSLAVSNKGDGSKQKIATVAIETEIENKEGEKNSCELAKLCPNQGESLPMKNDSSKSNESNITSEVAPSKNNKFDLNDIQLSQAKNGIVENYSMSSCVVISPLRKSLTTEKRGRSQKIIKKENNGLDEKYKRQLRAKINCNTGSEVLKRAENSVQNKIYPSKNGISSRNALDQEDINFEENNVFSVVEDPNATKIRNTRKRGRQQKVAGKEEYNLLDRQCTTQLKTKRTGNICSEDSSSVQCKSHLNKNRTISSTSKDQPKNQNEEKNGLSCVENSTNTKITKTRKRGRQKKCSVKEENILLDEKRTAQLKTKRNLNIDSGDSSFIETSVEGKTYSDGRTISSISTKDDIICPIVQQDERTSRRNRSKPARFRDNGDSEVLDSSSTKSTFLRKHKNNLKNHRNSESSSSLSHTKNSTASDSMESLDSLSSGGVQNIAGTLFAKPVKSSRNSRKKCSPNESVADKISKETKHTTKEANTNNEVGKRSRNRDSFSSVTSEDSKTSLVVASPRRSVKRVQQVLFTGLNNPVLESYITKLGGTVVDSVTDCSVLVTDKVRRTVKFLCVVGQGKPIVNPDWITQSWNCSRFEDPLNYLLLDKESEQKFTFSLSLTLQQAKAQALLTGYTVHATPNVKPPPQDIASIVESCGGVYVERVPARWPKQSLVISHVDDKQLWSKMRVRGSCPPLVAAEALLSGVLQHRLDLLTHSLT